MATALSLDRNELINSAFRKLGVIGQGETATASEITEGAEALNILLKSLDAAPWFKWFIKSDPHIFRTTAGTRRYALNAGTMWVESAIIQEVEAESLDETDFATNVNWDVTGDFDDTDDATFTHSAGTGTLTQVAADQATAAVGKKLYVFKYTVSSAGADASASIGTGYAVEATSLTLTDGTHYTHFWSAASPVDFVITGTSTAAAGNFTLDDVSLKQCKEGEYPLEVLTVGEYAHIMDKSRPGIPTHAYVTSDLSTPKMYLWPCPNADLAISYWPRRKADLFDSATDTSDLPEEWYRALVYLLCVDLAPEYGKGLEERAMFQQMANDAVAIAKQNQTQQIVGQEVQKPSSEINSPSDPINMGRAGGV